MPDAGKSEADDGQTLLADDADPDDHVRRGAAPRSHQPDLRSGGVPGAQGVENGRPVHRAVHTEIVGPGQRSPSIA
jgi:hypothetical protein